MSSRRFSESPGRWDSWGLLWRVERRLCSPGHALDTTALSKKHMSWTWTGYEKTQKFIKWKAMKGSWGFVCLAFWWAFFVTHAFPRTNRILKIILGPPDFRPRSRMGCNCRRLATWSQSFPLRPEGFWCFLMVFGWRIAPGCTMKIHEDPWRVTRLKFLQDSCPTPGLHCIYVAGLRRVTYILEVTGWRPWNMSI